MTSERATEVSYVPIRYWNRVRNIGDSINPFIVNAVSGAAPRICYDSDVPHVLGIGSIIKLASKQSRIWGSGILNPTAELPPIDPARIHALRGQLTLDLLRKRLGTGVHAVLGDPGVLVKDIPEIAAMAASAEVRHKIGLVPNHASYNHPYFSDLLVAGNGLLIDPRTDRLSFFQQFLSCEIIVSQSLHGLIFAECFGKPYVWISHSSDETWLFKFRDWFSTTREAPGAPIMFGRSLKQVTEEARLYGLAVDEDALRSSMPQLREPGPPLIDFRTNRSRSPQLIRVLGIGETSCQFEYDEIVNLPGKSEPVLRRNLNRFAARFAEHGYTVLVFDEQLYASLKMSEMRRLYLMLDDRPDTHYLSFQRNTPQTNVTIAERRKKLGEFSIIERAKDRDFGGVTILRHPVNFSFDAPALTVCRSDPLP